MGEIPWSKLISILHRWVQYLGCGYDRPLGSRNGPSAIGPQLFGSSAVVWYVMCPDYLNWALWVRFNGWYWYQSFIDGSNIWGADRTVPWGPEMDHPPLGRSYLGRFFCESNIAAKFSSAAAKINFGYNILAAKYFAAALQRKKLTFLSIPIYIYIYI